MSTTVTNDPHMSSRAPVAVQVGLVPGFALQDGDRLALLLHEAGSWGLGLSTDPEVRPEGNNNFDMAQEIRSSVIVLEHVTHTDNSLRLPLIQPGKMIRVYHMGGTHHAHIFPATRQQRIDAAMPGHSVWLSGNARAEYLYIGHNRWLSNLLGSASA